MNETILRCEKMVAQYPSNELARFSLGKAWYDVGEYGRALGEFALASERKPDWMVVQILIGKCAMALGNRARARAAFERGLALAIAQHHEGPQAELQQILAEWND